MTGIPPFSISAMNFQARCFGQLGERDHLVARDRLLAVVEAVLVALVGERLDEPDLATHVRGP